MGEVRRLYRSESDRMLGGVCGGLAAYLGLDPTLIRVAFVAATFFVGAGPLVYLVMWIIVPRRSQMDAPPGDVARSAVDEVREQARRGAEEARSAYERWRAGSGSAEGSSSSADGPPSQAPPPPSDVEDDLVQGTPPDEPPGPQPRP